MTGEIFYLISLYMVLQYKSTTDIKNIQQMYERNINLLRKTGPCIQYNTIYVYSITASTHKELHGVSWLVAGW